MASGTHLYLTSDFILRFLVWPTPRQASPEIFFPGVLTNWTSSDFTNSATRKYLTPGWAEYIAEYGGTFEGLVNDLHRYERSTFGDTKVDKIPEFLHVNSTTFNNHDVLVIHSFWLHNKAANAGDYLASGLGALHNQDFTSGVLLMVDKLSSLAVADLDQGLLLKSFEKDVSHLMKLHASL